MDATTGLPPWREVVSGSGSNTEGASKIVNFFLNPLNMKVASYLQDTRHMLAKLKSINEERGPLPMQTRLVAIDAVAMYPSVPSKGPRGGVAAAERALRAS